MNRIYHHYEKWECWKNGFWDSCSGSVKEDKKNKVIELFNSSENTKIFMNRVIDEWKYSSEQNLSNDSMNRIAWIGQAACCIYDKIPSSVTMEAWSLVPDESKQMANKIAQDVLDKWISKHE